MIDTPTGHKIKGSTGAKVYTFRSIEDMRAGIGRLAYPGLELPRAYEQRRTEEGRA